MKKLILLILLILAAVLSTPARAQTCDSFSLLAWPNPMFRPDSRWRLDRVPFSPSYHYQYRQRPLFKDYNPRPLYRHDYHPLYRLDYRPYDLYRGTHYGSLCSFN